MREAWQANIPRMWKERKVEIPEGTKPEDLIKVPNNAQYFAALGSVEFGKDEEPEVGRYLGTEKLALLHRLRPRRGEGGSWRQGPGRRSIRSSTPSSRHTRRRSSPRRSSIPGRSSPASSESMAARPRPRLSCWAKTAKILCKTYQLSNGNPIQDTIEMFEKLREQIESRGASLEVLGVGTTGYAKDILKRCAATPTSLSLKPSPTPNRRSSSTTIPTSSSTSADRTSS